MTKRLLALVGDGTSDETIAEVLNQEGFRGVKGNPLTAGTIKRLRHKHRRIRNPHGLTVPQVAKAIHVDVGWLYRRIHERIIQVDKNPLSGKYEFPDEPQTIE